MDEGGFIERNRIILKTILLFFIFVLILNFFIYDILLYENFSKEFTANISAFLLNLFGVSASVDGYFITVSGFSLEVVPECVGIFSMIVYSSFILAYPADLKKKLIGIAFGIPGLFALSIVRISSLAVIGMAYPGMWEYFHAYLWQLNLIIFVIIFLLLWIEKVVKPSRK